MNHKEQLVKEVAELEDDIGYWEAQIHRSIRAKENAEDELKKAENDLRAKRIILNSLN